MCIIQHNDLMILLQFRKQKMSDKTSSATCNEAFFVRCSTQKLYNDLRMRICFGIVGHFDVKDFPPKIIE